MNERNNAMTENSRQREPIRALLPPFELEQLLRNIGEHRYHHRHPFHLRMHEGRLTRGQLQAWALNRFYYQGRVPIKDAVILSRCEDPEFRRAWRSRIEDHDGAAGQPGGIERWLQLAQATGLPRELVQQGRGVLPAVRFAVDAYVQLVRERSFLEAVASSLTEMFAGSLIALRLDALRHHYPWMAGGLDYFEARLTQAPRDARFALDWVQRNALSPEDQERACRALEAKCDILWAQLDALYFAYVEPGWPPPGAFVPEAG
jgi:pyrroloquinoline-quinone synthase